MSNNTDCRKCKHYNNMKCTYADKDIYNPLDGYCNHFELKEEWTHISTGLFNDTLTDGEYSVGVNPATQLINLEFTNLNMLTDISMEVRVAEDLIDAMIDAIKELEKCQDM